MDTRVGRWARSVWYDCCCINILLQLCLLKYTHKIILCQRKEPYYLAKKRGKVLLLHFNHVIHIILFISSLIIYNYNYITYNMALYCPMYGHIHYLPFGRLDLLLCFLLWYWYEIHIHSNYIGWLYYQKSTEHLHSLHWVFFFLLFCPVACNFQLFFHNNLSYIFSWIHPLHHHYIDKTLPCLNLLLL